MKNLILAILVAFSTAVCAQEYNACTQYSDFGDFAKAKSCLDTWKTKYANDPAYHYQLMYHAVKSNDAAAATALMEKINTLPATDFYTLSAKSIYFSFSNDIAKARLAYESVVANHKTAPMPVLTDVIRAFFSYKTKDPDYANTWIRTLRKEIKTPSATLEMLEGDFYAAQGDHGNALNFYNQVLDIEPKNSLAFYKKAVAYRRIRNFSAALSELESALKITPDFPNAVLEKAEVLFELKRPDDGIAVYNDYFKMVPEDKIAHLQYGSALFASKKFEEAEKQADYVLQSDSGNISALKLKSYTSYELGRYEQGQLMLSNFLSKADTSIITSKDHEYMAYFYQKAGNDSLALESYKKALQYPGVRGELYSEVGNLMIKKAHYQDALNTYQAKLAVHKGSSADYFNYGRAALAIDSFALADSLFGKVTEMQPTWPNGFLMRANANAHLDPGSTEGRALPFYEKFIQLAETDTANAAKLKTGLLESYRYMGYYYFLNKDIPKSKSYWNKVLALDPNDKQAKDVLKQLKD